MQMGAQPHKKGGPRGAQVNNAPEVQVAGFFQFFYTHTFVWIQVCKCCLYLHTEAFQLMRRTNIPWKTPTTVTFQFLLLFVNIKLCLTALKHFARNICNAYTNTGCYEWLVKRKVEFKNEAVGKWKKLISLKQIVDSKLISHH